MPKASSAKRRVKEEKDESSSDSSGPEDRNPAPSAKKAKTAESSKPAAKGSIAVDEERSWELDKNRSIKVRCFKGKTYIDIREYYEKDGKQMPGKKGISLSVSQWAKLKSLITEVDEAVEEI